MLDSLLQAALEIMDKLLWHTDVEGTLSVNMAKKRLLVVWAFCNEAGGWCGHMCDDEWVSILFFPSTVWVTVSLGASSSLRGRLHTHTHTWQFSAGTRRLDTVPAEHRPCLTSLPLTVTQVHRGRGVIQARHQKEKKSVSSVLEPLAFKLWQTWQRLKCTSRCCDTD